MKNIKIVIGANFGDEGKGLMTDYFCSKFPDHEKVLNVRFNGGAQAGHTVVAPDGRRHVFHHFGSGSFLPNVATYLGREFIANPILFRKEYEELERIGIYPMVYVHPKCLLTIPQDMMMNQFLETARGADRHGSCGAGIFETKMRSRIYTGWTVEQTDFGMLDFPYLIDYDAERYERLLGIPMSHEIKRALNNQNIQAHFMDDVDFFLNHIIVADEGILERFDSIVFEGGQGLMLDQNNMDYFPHLTPSNTGIKNVISMLKDLSEKNMNIEACYVTRPYLTRHGAGKLPDECTREETGAKIDLTNVENEWQGKLRYGKLDQKKLVERCFGDFCRQMAYFSDANTQITFALTHIDEFAKPGRPVEETSCTEPFGGSITDITDICDGIYSSYGPTRKDVRQVCKYICPQN